MQSPLDASITSGADERVYGPSVQQRSVKRERGASSEKSATAPATVSGERR